MQGVIRFVVGGRCQHQAFQKVAGLLAGGEIIAPPYPAVAVAGIAVVDNPFFDRIAVPIAEQYHIFAEYPFYIIKVAGVSGAVYVPLVHTVYPFMNRVFAFAV